MPGDKRKSEKEKLQDPFEIKPYKSSDIEKQTSWEHNVLTKKKHRKAEVEGSGDIEAETFVDKSVIIMNKHKKQGKNYLSLFVFIKILK